MNFGFATHPPRVEPVGGSEVWPRPDSPPSGYAVASGRLCVSAPLRLCVLFSVSELCVSVSLWFFGRRPVETA